jgi:CRP-like cAMP-binding protein
MHTSRVSLFLARKPQDLVEVEEWTVPLVEGPRLRRAAACTKLVRSHRCLRPAIMRPGGDKRVVAPRETDVRRAPEAVPLTTIDLVDAWPELARYLPPADLALARRALASRVATVEDDDLFELLETRAPGALTLLIVDGVVLKETKFAGRSALELLGPGDLLAPPLTAARQAESPAVSRYRPHGAASLAVLDDRFRHAARRWPGLIDCLHDCLGRQTHRASRHLAVLHLPRVEDRIVALFVDLAERFGRMTRDGIVIDLPLTHQVIGDLVASRRPTVSLALQALAEDGVMGRLDDGRWHLAPRAVPL